MSSWRTSRGLTRPEALVWLRHRGLLDGPRTDAGRGAGRFSGRAAARHRTLPKNGSTGLTGPGENPDRAVKMWERSVAAPATADHPARRCVNGGVIMDRVGGGER